MSRALQRRLRKDLRKRRKRTQWNFDLLQAMRTQMKRRSHKEEELTRSFRDTWKSTVASLTRLTDSFDSTARGFHLPTLESELPSFEEIRRRVSTRLYATKGRLPAVMTPQWPIPEATLPPDLQETLQNE